MLFSTEPKSSIGDLFDRELEVKKLKNSLNERMILVLGLRRIGKSSLVLSTLNSLDVDFIFIDVRKAYDDVSKKVPAERLYGEMRSSLLRLSKGERVKDLLSRLNVSLEYPVKVRISAEEIKDNIVKIFEALNDIGRVIVVFDEAQYLRYSTVGLRPVLAHVYDYMDGITLILTGSEVGLLHDFVGVDDPDSELYGRYHSSIELKPLDGEKSREFLRKGFEQLGIREEVRSMGVRLLRKELDEAFSRSPYYIHIMKAIAILGRARWKNVLNYVTAQVGRVGNATMSRDLKNLVKMGFVEKEGDEYVIGDPLVRYAVLEGY